jgi:hypothetical protein
MDLDVKALLSIANYAVTVRSEEVVLIIYAINNTGHDNWPCI